MKEKQAPLFVDSAVEGTLPPISILDPAEQKKIKYSPESLAGVGHCWKSSSRNSASKSPWIRSTRAR
jgi:hypothetical protein